MKVLTTLHARLRLLCECDSETDSAVGWDVVLRRSISTGTVHSPFVRCSATTHTRHTTHNRLTRSLSYDVLYNLIHSFIHSDVALLAWAKVSIFMLDNRNSIHKITHKTTTILV